MSRQAVVLSYAALIVLLTAGTAVGAAGHSTIFSNDIAKHQVKTSDIDTGAVTSKKIKDHTITSVDLSPGLVSLLGAGGGQGATGSSGSTGPIGPAGPTGPAGPAGTAHAAVHEVYKDFTTDGNSGALLGSVDCPAGSVATGGGFFRPQSPDVAVDESNANFANNSQTPTGWEVQIESNVGGVLPAGMILTVYAECLSF